MERPAAAQTTGCKPPRGGQRHGGRAPPALGPAGPPDPHRQLRGALWPERRARSASSPQQDVRGALQPEEPTLAATHCPAVTGTCLCPSSPINSGPPAHRALWNRPPTPRILTLFTWNLPSRSGPSALQEHLPRPRPSSAPAPSTPRPSDPTACLSVPRPRHVTHRTDSPPRDVASSSAPSLSLVMILACAPGSPQPPPSPMLRLTQAPRPGRWPCEPQAKLDSRQEARLSRCLGIGKGGGGGRTQPETAS